VVVTFHLVSDPSAKAVHCRYPGLASISHSMVSSCVLGSYAYEDQVAKALGYEHASFSLLYCSKQSGGGISAARIWSAVHNKGNTLTVAQAPDGRGIGAFLTTPWSAQDSFVRVCRMHSTNSVQDAGVDHLSDTDHQETVLTTCCGAGYFRCHHEV
jgi:hypothetical protein